MLRTPEVVVGLRESELFELGAWKEARRRLSNGGVEEEEEKKVVED